jgi:hypothetical protein
MNGPADDVAVQSMLAAVGRRLWRRRFARAARTALWAWAAILAVAAALHLAAGRPGFLTAVALGAAAWVAAVAWAAMQRPTRSESALYADRFLGGASAYATLLEAGTAIGSRNDTPALRWLAQWAAATAPASRQALEARHDPLRLARPLATAGICTAVAAVVMSLPVAPSGTTDRLATVTAGEAGPAEPLSLGEPGLAETLAAELATQIPPEDAGHGSMVPADGSAVGAGPDGAARSEALTETDAAGARGAVTPGSGAAGPGEALDVESADGRPGRPGLAPAPGTGREAGASRDDAAAGEGSRALQGSMTVVRRELNGMDETDRRADMEQAGTYLDDAAAAGMTPPAVASVAPARPPAARREARLSPVEAAYVDAWRAARREAP